MVHGDQPADACISLVRMRQSRTEVCSLPWHLYWMESYYSRTHPLLVEDWKGPEAGREPDSVRPGWTGPSDAP